MIEILEKCPLFAGVAAKKIETLFKEAFFQIRNYEDGAFIASQGEVVENVMIILEGVVKGEMNTFMDKSVTIDKLMPGMLIAPAFIFGENNYYPVNAIAIENVKVLRIPKSDFVAMIRKDEALLVNFMDRISGRAQLLSDKLRFLFSNSIKGKLAYYILEQSVLQKSDNIIMKHSHQELSELFGVVRPSLTRVISDLNKENIILSKGKKVSIINKDSLSSLLN